MSHGTSHHHHGDGGSHAHHSSKHSGVEHSESHSHHQSSTFHALHHEATASLSSKPAATHHDANVHVSDSHAKPAVAKTAETVHISTAKPEKSAASTKSGLSHTANIASTEKPVQHILDLHSIPKLSIINESRANPQSTSSELAKLVPPHLSDSKPAVQRVAG